MGFRVCSYLAGSRIFYFLGSFLIKCPPVYLTLVVCPTLHKTLASHPQPKTLNSKSSTLNPRAIKSDGNLTKLHAILLGLCFTLRGGGGGGRHTYTRERGKVGSLMLRQKSIKLCLGDGSCDISINHLKGIIWEFNKLQSRSNIPINPINPLNPKGLKP